jgi:predicted  nucleic acid-binding Zn-ribbon protein
MKLAFYKYIPNSGEPMSVENVRDLILESFRLLRDDTDELKESQLAIMEDLARMKNRQSELEKELIKLELKLKNAGKTVI